MKLWIDDIRPAPKKYIWCKSVNDAIECINQIEGCYPDAQIDLIDIDYDAGDYVYDGGDYIEVLNWLEKIGISYPIHIHSMNPIGIENMRRVIRKNGWKEM